MSSTPEQLQHARALLADADGKLARLRQIEPYLIDVSLRESPVGSALGHTLANKLAILPQLRAFGLRNISLGTLDYDMPDELEVDDDFMQHLRDQGIDMRGCYAFTALGLQPAEGPFAPHPSQLKLRAYGVPNTVHEIYLSRRGMAGNYDLDTLRRSLPASIQWLHDHIRGDDGGAPRILVNIADGCDAFAESLETTCSILALLATLPIEGVTIEDDRGTFLPFQVGAFVAVMRSLLPPPLKILVHLHAGGGFENASAIEALLNGADGLWAALPKRAAIIGHASLGELLANLARVGNPHVHAYALDQLQPLATRLQLLDQQGAVPEDLPILGTNAYRISFSGFRQLEHRFMDLPAPTIGARHGHRICPVISDPATLAGRLAEVTGEPASNFPEPLTRQMIRLMRRDLRAGIRLAYDEPGRLRELLARALGEPSTTERAGSPVLMPALELY